MARKTAWPEKFTDETRKRVAEMMQWAIEAGREIRCGCCGIALAEEQQEFCETCKTHVLKDEEIVPWDRTYFAQHGVDCPLRVKPQ